MSGKGPGTFMSENTPPAITVQETRDYEVAADRANLFVVIEGTSFFTGDEALKKTREVAQLVADLTAFGLLPEAVFLQSVSAEAHTGTITKTSRAKYRLRVHCADLPLLAGVVGVITAQKNANLSLLEWGYPDTDARRDDWLLACIARVNQKADKIAAALGVRILGVAAFTEKLDDPEYSKRAKPAPSGEGLMYMRRMDGGEDLGMDVSHIKTVQVSVKVDFLVSGRE